MNRLSEILKEQGRTQAYLSRELKKSANTINNWCRNVTQPSLIEAKKISDLLDTSLDELIIEDTKNKGKND